MAAVLIVVSSFDPLQAAPGGLDPAFGKQGTDFGMGDEGIEAFELQSDGAIVAAGCARCSSVNGDWLVARFTSTGGLDPSFNGDGWLTIDFAGFYGDYARDVAVQADGSIVVVGLAQVGFSQHDFGVVRLTSQGVPDDGFGFDGDGSVTTDFGLGGEVDRAAAVAIQADGRIVATGSAETPSGTRRFAIARYLDDGSLDPSFGGGDGRVTTSFPTGAAEAHALAVRPNGKIVVVGTTGRDVAVVRYMPDGSLDGSFSGDGKVITNLGYGDAATDIAVQADGKYVVVGETFAQGEDQDFAVLRYGPKGRLDGTFSGDGKVLTDFHGEHDRALGVAIQANARIVVVGSVTVDDLLDFGLARYRPNGRLDVTFSRDGKVRTDFSGFEDFASDVRIQDDGKILVGGWAREESPVTGFDYNFGLARYLAV